MYLVQDTVLFLLDKVTIDVSSDDEEVSNLMQDVQNLSRVPPFNVLDPGAKRSDTSYLWCSVIIKSLNDTCRVLNSFISITYKLIVYEPQKSLALYAIYFLISTS